MPAHLSVGDVVRLFDGTTDPAKPKRFLCVCVAEGWFLRINSRSIWRPHFPIPHAGNEHCLDHDSFLELRGIIEYDDYLIDDALSNPRNNLGPLDKSTVAQIVEFLPTARSVPKAQRNQIIAALSALL